MNAEQVAYLKVLADAGLIRRTRSEGDRRRSYVFVCTHNSARSQFAAGIWTQRSRIPTASAGTRPAERVHPRAIRVARRHGLRLDPTRTAHVDQVVRRDDLVIALDHLVPVLTTGADHD